jgi:GNAT superfamily N-acetyltransferase
MLRIRTVETQKDWKEFLEFPNRLYAGSPYYVPALLSGEKKAFDPDRNPAYEYCRTICVLAEEDGKTVGRAAGIINDKRNAASNTKNARFSRFDVIDDPEVTRALMERLDQWAGEQGMERLLGPMGFSGFDRQGMLVEGFDYISMMITLYNYSYYPRHLEQLGFTKEVDWVEYRIAVPEALDERIRRISAIAQKRNGYQLVDFASKKQALPYIRKMFGVYNRAFASLYGFSPLTGKQIEQTIKEYISLIPLEYVLIVTDSTDEVIGFGIMAPSVSEAVRDAKGKLSPFGWLKIRKAVKTSRVLDLYLIAVVPEYAGRGVNAVILNEGIQRAIDNGLEFAETGPELEDNESVKSQWKSFDAAQHKRRRCYVREIIS